MTTRKDTGFGRQVDRETIAQSREAARGMMLMKSPQIARDAVQLRLSKVSGD